MTKRGKKPFVLTEAHIKKAEAIAARGGTLEQIAAALGISSTTLCKNRRQSEALDEAITKGRYLGLTQVENVIFEAAVRDKSLTAAIFYVKNRAPEKWLAAERATFGKETANKIEVEIVGAKSKEKAKPKAKSPAKAKPATRKKPV